MSCKNPNFSDQLSALRAQQLVTEEIRNALFQLSLSNSSREASSYSQKVCAMSHVGSKLLCEVEEMQNYTTLYNEIIDLKTERDKIHEYYQKREVDMQTKIASLEEKTAVMRARQYDLEGEVAGFSREAQDSHRELEIRSGMDEETHERYVQLHMDIMAYHRKVRDKVTSCQKCIKAKVGFMPREVGLLLNELQELEPPGIDLVFGASPVSPGRRTPHSTSTSVTDSSERRYSGKKQLESDSVSRRSNLQVDVSESFSHIL